MQTGGIDYLILKTSMFNNKMLDKCFLTAALLLFASALGSAQDLGSSNGLFNAPNPKSKTVKPAVKKVAAKKAAPEKNTSAAAVKKTAAKTKAAALAARRAARDRQKTATTTVRAKNNQSAAAKRQTVIDKQNTDAPVAKIEPPVVPAASVEPSPAVVKPVFDERFETAIDEGNAARDERDYVKAEAAYLRAQSLGTRDARAVYGLGNLYSDQQRWEEAERAYRAAIQLAPDSPEAFIALSFVLTQPLNGTNLADRYAEAEDKARQAIKIDQTSAVAFDQLGAALELRGVIEGETETVYRKAIELEPNFALAYAHLGRLLRRKGLNNESAAAYRKAIEFAAGVPTMILVADVMQTQQRYVESEQLLRQALRQDPKNPTALNMLGRALTTRGSFDEAEKVLKKSADVSPNSFASHSLLAALFLRRQKFDDAEKYLLKALKNASTSEKKRLAQDFEAVGDGYLSRGENKDAARVFQQAIALDAQKTALTDKLAKAQSK